MEIYQALILIVSAVGALSYFYGKHIERTNSQKARDKKIYSEIMEKIPEKIVVYYIRDHDFGEVHDGKVHDVLLDFYFYCKKPDAYFMDKELENAREKLFYEANEFSNILANETFTAREKGMFETPPEVGFDERKKIGDQINQQKRKFYDGYANFVKIASRNLT
jgi:hypothetical protein